MAPNKSAPSLEIGNEDWHVTSILQPVHTEEGTEICNKCQSLVLYVIPDGLARFIV